MARFDQIVALLLAGGHGCRIHSDRPKQFMEVAGIPVIAYTMRTLQEHPDVDAVYVVASYTYGPLLGLFAFGLFTRRMPRGRAIPWICMAAPVCCRLLDAYTTSAFGYRFGYELLMLNGLLTFAGLWLTSTACRPKRPGPLSRQSSGKCC